MDEYKEYVAMDSSKATGSMYKGGLEPEIGTFDYNKRRTLEERKTTE